MLIFNTLVLRDHGVELNRTKEGFTLQGTEEVSQEALDALRHASKQLNLDTIDGERLVEFAVDLGLWCAVKAATHETPLRYKD